MDLDGTLTLDAPGVDYRYKPVNWQVVQRLKEYRELGYRIVVFTARNMRTYEGNLELIRSKTLPIIEAWMASNDIPYDEIVIGKPWCGTEGFYVDDRAMRPDEFSSLSPDDVNKLLGIGNS